MTVSRWILFCIFCGGVNFSIMISDWASGNILERVFGFFSLAILICVLWKPNLVIEE